MALTQEAETSPCDTASIAVLQHSADFLLYSLPAAAAALSACNPGLGLPPCLLLSTYVHWLSFAQLSQLLSLLAELHGVLWHCGDTQGPG